MSDEVDIDALRTFLGLKRFLKFVAATREHDRLLSWQEEALRRLAAERGIQLGLGHASLKQLLASVDLRQLPEIPALPPWCGVEFFGGQGPVQAWGQFGSCRWYFRARGRYASVHVSADNQDPLDVSSTDASHHFHEEEYGFNDFSASYMPEGEARYFIVRELERVKAHLSANGARTG